MRYLGIDFGTRKIGLAISDEAGTMGFPYGIVPNDSRLLEDMAKIAEKEGVEAFVIGESLNREGKDNPVMEQARAFAGELQTRTNLPIFYEMEAFTTQEASRDFEGERMPGRLLVDASAAAIILTSYLGRTKHD